MFSENLYICLCLFVYGWTLCHGVAEQLVIIMFKKFIYKN